MAKKSQMLKLTGKAYWAKLFENNRDMNEDFHGPGGATTIQLYCNQDTVEEYLAAGGRIKPKSDEEGVYLQFKRKFIHETIPSFGGLPQVVVEDDEGNIQDWDGTLIGNGSEVEVAVTLYDSKMGKGTRLEGVRIINLVEMPEMDSAPALPF